MRLKIYGASDDLIEVEGDAQEEFNHFSKEPAFLHLGTAAVVKCQYANDGIWRLEVVRIVMDARIVSFKTGSAEGDTNDMLVIEGENLTPLGFWSSAEGPTDLDMREWIENEWDQEGPHHMSAERAAAVFKAMWGNR